MRQLSEQIDLNGGFYTIVEAARLLGMENGRKISRWIRPTQTGQNAVVLHDYPRLGRQQELSFFDLIEIKFVEHFRQAGVSVQSLRVASQNARERLGVCHPFATGNVKFQTDRKKVFLETAEETGDSELLDLMTRQVVMYEIIEQSFAADLEFDARGFAKVWRPATQVAPNVLVSPYFAFGRPVVSGRKLPTQMLFESWKAHEKRSDDVADWFDINVEDVNEAVRFELRQLH